MRKQMAPLPEPTKPFSCLENLSQTCLHVCMCECLQSICLHVWKTSLRHAEAVNGGLPVQLVSGSMDME